MNMIPNLKYCLILSWAIVIVAWFLSTASAHTLSAGHPHELDHPLELVEMDIDIGPSINRVYSINFDTHGVAVSNHRPGRVERRQGRNCLVGGYFLFDVKDEILFNTDETLELELTFDRGSSTGFGLSYDKAGEPGVKTVEFDKKNKISRWYTQRVSLDRARFANRKYEGTDFGVAAKGYMSWIPDPAELELALCKIKLIRKKKPILAKPVKGLLNINIQDESGRPTQARVGIYSDNGKAPLASNSALKVPRWSKNDQIRDLPMAFVPKGWSDKGRFIFYVDGHYKAQLEEGSYTAYVMKGPEYRIIKQSFKVSKDKPVELTILLNRWQNFTDQGWYSGDDHIHLGRDSDKKNPSLVTMMKAEDLHVANLLEMGNLGGSAFQQYAYGKKGHYRDGRYSLVSGQESPRTTHRGHTIGLNTKQFHWPDMDYYNYDATSDAIHKEGGLWGYAHVIDNVFDLEYGIALDIPRGKVDFLEILQIGMINTDYLYDFLNLGFKLVPTGGSDYPYLQLPGTERIYVKTNSSEPSAWFKQLKNGRSQVSNGPLIQCSINNDNERSEYNLTKGEKVSIRATVTVNPDYDVIDRLELIGHGKVLKTVTDTGTGSQQQLMLETEFAAIDSMWLALRAYGKTIGLAHTAPIYLYIDGNKSFGDPLQKAAIADKYIKILHAFKKITPSVDEEWEQLTAGPHMSRKWEHSKTVLEGQINDTLAIYEQIKRSWK